MESVPIYLVDFASSDKVKNKTKEIYLLER